ncbi:MAG: diguanylate cyclase, partial [Ignavibacteria bacterium]|nr:diguanylate cyclase [Ignavibacteria bacterium]
MSELNDARRVQMSLMPETAPEVEGLQIAGKCVSANTVSGDFFDYLEGENEIAIVVGDVTG